MNETTNNDVAELVVQIYAIHEAVIAESGGLQASRIPGLTPAAISLLLVYFKKRYRAEKAQS